MVIDREKKSNNTLNELKPVENINHNGQSFQRKRHMRKKVPSSHKLLYHTYEY